MEGDATPMRECRPRDARTQPSRRRQVRVSAGGSPGERRAAPPISGRPCRYNCALCAAGRMGRGRAQSRPRRHGDEPQDTYPLSGRTGSRRRRNSRTQAVDRARGRRLRFHQCARGQGCGGQCTGLGRNRERPGRNPEGPRRGLQRPVDRRHAMERTACSTRVRGNGAALPDSRCLSAWPHAVAVRSA